MIDASKWDNNLWENNPELLKEIAQLQKERDIAVEALDKALDTLRGPRWKEGNYRLQNCDGIQVIREALKEIREK